MKALRIFCLGGLLLYAQVGMGQDSIRTEHLQEVKVRLSGTVSTKQLES